MTEDNCQCLMDHVHDFIKIGPHGAQHTLCDFLQLTGWTNWSFNVFPLLKPCLLNIYANTVGKVKTCAEIYVNNTIVNDLTWFLHHVSVSDGVYVLDVIDRDSS